MATSAEFFADVRDVRDTLDISPGRGGLKDRQRIALSITDAFLRVGGDIHAAPFLEWQLYLALIGLGLSCNPTPEELRCEEYKHLRDWDALRMHPRPPERFLAPCAVVKQIVTVLMEERPHANRTASPERIRERRSPDQTLGSKPAGLVGLAGQGAPLHPAGNAALLPRASGCRLDEAAGTDASGRTGHRRDALEGPNNAPGRARTRQSMVGEPVATLYPVSAPARRTP